MHRFIQGITTVLSTLIAISGKFPCSLLDHLFLYLSPYSVSFIFPASKMLCEKRLELFREAGSGLNLTAYYMALNISSAIEHSIQIIIIATPLIWFRCTLSSYICTLLSFIMMAWLATSWSLFIPIIIPPKNVLIVLAFFVVLFSTIFGGLQPPVDFRGTSP